MSTIYARAHRDNGYWLVNERGENVDLQGELSPVPLFYIGDPEASGYPVWKGEEE